MTFSSISLYHWLQASNIVVILADYCWLADFESCDFDASLDLALLALHIVQKGTPEIRDYFAELLVLKTENL